MSDTPAIGRITFSSIANPNTWAIDGDGKVLVFANPSEAKRAEELFSAMQRDLAAANERVEELERELAGWKRMMDEALNSGDGSYRP